MRNKNPFRPAKQELRNRLVQVMVTESMDQWLTLEAARQDVNKAAVVREAMARFAELQPNRRAVSV